MYKVGDKIVHPMHGAGTITAVEKKEILGEEQEFLILSMPIANMKISIPVNSLDSIGVRPIMSKEDGQKVLEVLRAEETEMPRNWNQRFRENQELLKTGNLFDVADVVRNLQLRDIERGLSTSEKKMLNNGRKKLVSELILIGSISVEEASEMIDEAISYDEEEEENNEES